MRFIRGIDSRLKLLGKISDKEIMNVIKETLGVEAVSDVKTWDCGKLDDLDFPLRNYGDEDHWIEEHGFITFEYNGEDRMLFYSHSNINVYENIDYYKKMYPDRADIVRMIKSETTSLSLGTWGSAVEILEKIVKKFGGWIDDNDCDYIPYRYVEKEV